MTNKQGIITHTHTHTHTTHPVVLRYCVFWGACVLGIHHTLYGISYKYVDDYGYGHATGMGVVSAILLQWKSEQNGGIHLYVYVRWMR